MAEQIFDLVKTYSVGRNQKSMVVLIPIEVREILGFKAKQMLHVKIDEKGRLIYEAVNGAREMREEE